MDNWPKDLVSLFGRNIHYFYSHFPIFGLERSNATPPDSEFTEYVAQIVTVVSADQIRSSFRDRCL